MGGFLKHERARETTHLTSYVLTETPFEMNNLSTLAGLNVQRKVCLRPYPTLRAGGPADSFVAATNADELANAAIAAQTQDLRMTMLGSGSNMLPSDKGVPGL